MATLGLTPDTMETSMPVFRLWKALARIRSATVTPLRHLIAILLLTNSALLLADENFLPPGEAVPSPQDTSRVFSSGPMDGQPPRDLPPVDDVNFDDPPMEVAPLDPPPRDPVPNQSTRAADAVRSVEAEATPPRPVPTVPQSTAALTVGSAAAGTMAVPDSTVYVQDQYFNQVGGTAPVYCVEKNLPHTWVSAEALIWWTNGVDVPAIATTSPQGTPGLQAGVTGQPGTQVLWGGGELFNSTRGGVRLRAGQWSDCNDGSGWQAEFFMLASQAEQFHGDSNGNPILARPFVNEQSGLPDAQLIAYPGLSTGSLNFNAESRMYSIAFHGWWELVEACDDGCGESCGATGCGESGCGAFPCGCCDDRNNFLGLRFGPRFIHHDDTLLIDESLTGDASGSQFRLMDSFKTENSFLGAELGLRGQRQRGNWMFDGGLNLAFGATRQELDVSGLNTVTAAGVATTTAGGFYAQRTNSGSWDETKFAIVPSLELELGYDMGSGWRATVGYNLLFWPNVLRAAEQIDPVIHEGLFPVPTAAAASATRPSPVLNESDYLAHGISIGVERRW